MKTTKELIASLRRAQAESPARVRQRYLRVAMLRCRRGCMRAVVPACSDACIGLVGDPAVDVIGNTYFYAFLVKSREMVAKGKRHWSLKEEKILPLLTITCWDKCVPQWRKQWAEVCRFIFKRVCTFMCMLVCERRCERTCRTTCARTERCRRPERTACGDLSQRLRQCLLFCIHTCLKSCMRTCKLIMPIWLNSSTRHICQPVVDQDAQPSASTQTLAKKLAEDLIGDRKAMTDKGNVRNGSEEVPTQSSVTESTAP